MGKLPKPIYGKMVDIYVENESIDCVKFSVVPNNCNLTNINFWVRTKELKKLERLSVIISENMERMVTEINNILEGGNDE